MSARAFFCLQWELPIVIYGNIIFFIFDLQTVSKNKISNYENSVIAYFKMVGVRRLELRTPCVSCKCSNQLSYTPLCMDHKPKFSMRFSQVKSRYAAIGFFLWTVSGSYPAEFLKHFIQLIFLFLASYFC